MQKPLPLMRAVAVAALLTAFASACPGAVIEMGCRLEQPVFLTEAPVPLRLFLIAREATEPVPILVHADYPRLGPRSCFKARCWGPDGVELPPALAPMPPWMADMVVPQSIAPHGPAWSVRIDLATWFRPPPGGPYRVEVCYDWPGPPRGKQPHWTGRTNVATATFSVRELNYGPLSASERARLDDLLEFLKQPQLRSVARDELAAMGPRALTALHDALGMGGLPRRAALIEALAAIGDESSLPPIIAANAGPTAAVPQAKERAVLAYGARAVPAVVEAMKRGLPDALPLAIRLGPKAVDPLMELLRSPDRTLDATALPMACLALGQIGDPRAVEALRQAAADPALRRVAQMALRNIAERRLTFFR